MRLGLIEAQNSRYQAMYYMTLANIQAFDKHCLFVFPFVNYVMLMCGYVLDPPHLIITTAGNTNEKLGRVLGVIL